MYVIIIETPLKQITQDITSSKRNRRLL